MRYANIDVIYISEEVSSSKVDAEVGNIALGIVNEEEAIVDELKVNGVR